MNKLSMDDIIKGKKSRYSFVMAVAKRAREINFEMETNEDKTLYEKPVVLAAKDFVDGKYEIFEPAETPETSNTEEESQM